MKDKQKNKQNSTSSIPLQGLGVNSPLGARGSSLGGWGAGIKF